ncbi:hypothetical protein R9C00_02675 [Flammeovirgaceae bacterium SG7u.111]|nr:hypothetical protein [Flammeovirgaceae bacterium SG7u.132]WPO36344.1 hypothetical protein R9C00_02675 [Flammeovirgaceae bacterium SG7u.111]
MKIKLLSVSVIATFMLGSVAVAQEYDDLYFSKKDRKEMQELTARVVKPSTDFGVQNQPTSKYANPDFNGGATVGNTYTPAYNYYDESVAQDGPLYNDNYQPGMNNWNRYGMNSPFYDPFMSPYGSMNPYYGGMGMMNPYYGSMMNPYYGMGSGWNMNMGYSSMFGPSMGMGYSRMLTSGLSMGLYTGMNSFGYGGYPGYAFGGYGYPVSYAYRPVEVSRVPAKTRMTSAPMQRKTIAQATATPDAQRKYPSRIRNFDARNASSTPASNGRYSRSSYNSNGNNSWSTPTRRSTGNNSSWGNSGSSPSYRSTSSSPSYSRPASSGQSSPSRATRSIRRN